MDDLDRLYRRLVHNIRANRPEYLQIPFTVRDLYEQVIPYRHNRRELAIDTNDDYEVAVARLLSGERGYLQGDPTMQESLRRELASPTGDPGLFKDFGDSTVSLTAGAPDARTPVGATSPAGMKTPVPAAADGGRNGVAGVVSAPELDRSQAPMAPDGLAPGTQPITGSSPVAQQTQETHQAQQPRPPEQQPTSQGWVANVAPAAAPAVAATQAIQNTHAIEAPVPSLLSSLSHIDVPTGCRFCGGTLPEGRDANYCPHCGENLHTKRCPACGAEMDTSWAYCVTCGRKAG